MEISIWKIQNSKFSFRTFGGTQVFDQTFSAVSDDRNSENLVRLQRVPSQNFGFSSQFSTVFRNQTFLTGFEANEVRGSSNEIGFFGGRATSRIGSGGRERTYGVYFQDFAKLGEKIILVGSLRYDSWENFRALSSLLSLSSNRTTTTIFPDRRESALSPSGSVLFQATNEFSLYFNASGSFRSPTLNELYRGFRVGSVVTNPNENLAAEKANNFETGLSYGKRNFYLRGNFYLTEINDSVANITINISPNLITRQRQNAGKTRVRGLEIEAETRVRGFNFSFGYLLADAEFADFPTNRELEGLRLPQVPLHQFTFQTRYTNQTGWSFALQGRASSEQFDDDLNQFRLEPYFQLDA
ncbi:MAG: TonB-dependent receptor, partial [Aridibacter sp.]